LSQATRKQINDQSYDILNKLMQCRQTFHTTVRKSGFVLLISPGHHFIYSS